MNNNDYKFVLSSAVLFQIGSGMAILIVLQWLP